MPIVVSIPTILRSLTANQKRIEATGANVLEVIDEIDARYPGVKDRLISGGKMHRFVNIFVNENDIRFAGDLKTAVQDGDHITILPAVAGGRGRSPSES
ncbi:MoaD family protein [Methylosinus sp. Ce-a6]|uniref:MoaD family protein n=1 Tax=Methylosinus sp. Ce-a6 TaxID=2172005 RepID=UPI001357786F|nr:MoaD family protein [Methylosinus sp. Ce-a6]